MASKKKAPSGEPLITQTELAARIVKGKAEITRMKQSGLYRGFYDDGVLWSEFFPSYMSATKRQVEEKIRSGTASEAEEFGKMALARKRLREDQIADGQTIFVIEVVDAMEKIAVKYRQGMSRVSATMSMPIIKLFGDMMLEGVSDEDRPAVARALARIDQGKVQTFLQARHNRAIGDMGEMVRQVIPEAVASAKAAR